MNDLYNKDLITLSQTLRKSMTKEERKLWYDFLKRLPINFYRQKTIGNYIVDFYCAKPKTVIELDGSQHYQEENEKEDRIRDCYLNSKGITVLRYSNYEINKNFEGVCQDILTKLGINL